MFKFEKALPASSEPPKYRKYTQETQDRKESTPESELEPESDSDSD